MKKKKWRFFLLGQNISNYTFLKLWTSLISNMYSDFSYLFSIKSYSPSKWVHFACFCPFLTIFSLLWRAVIFDRSKIWKIRKHIWNQRSSKAFEKYKLKYFGQVEKIFIFFFFIFHLHFWIFWKFLKPSILPLRIIFSTRYYF